MDVKRVTFDLAVYEVSVTDNWLLQITRRSTSKRVRLSFRPVLSYDLG